MIPQKVIPQQPGPGEVTPRRAIIVVAKRTQHVNNLLSCSFQKGSNTLTRCEGVAFQNPPITSVQSTTPVLILSTISADARHLDVSGRDDDADVPPPMIKARSSLEKEREARKKAETAAQEEGCKLKALGALQTEMIMSDL